MKTGEVSGGNHHADENRQREKNQEREEVLKNPDEQRVERFHQRFQSLAQHLDLFKSFLPHPKPLDLYAYSQLRKRLTLENDGGFG